MSSTIKYTSHLNKCVDSINSTLQKNMQEACKLFRDETKSSLNSTSGSGRVYKVKGILHRASAPNEPPTKLTGSLQSSIRYRTYKQVRSIKGEVFSDSINAVYQEMGTRKQAPRPFFKPTYERIRPELIRILSRR